MEGILKIKGKKEDIKKFILNELFVNYISLNGIGNKNEKCGASIKLFDDLNKNIPVEDDNLIIYSPKERQIDNETILFQSFGFNLTEEEFPEDETFFIETFNDKYNQIEQYYYILSEGYNDEYFLSMNIMFDINKKEKLKNKINLLSNQYHLIISFTGYENTLLEEINIIKTPNEEINCYDYTYSTFEDYFFNKKIN